MPACMRARAPWPKPFCSRCAKPPQESAAAAQPASGLRAVVSTYTAESGVELVEIPFQNGTLDLEFVKKHLTTDVAAVIVQTPNFFGIVESPEAIAPLAQAAGALFISCVNPISLGLLTPPGEYGQTSRSAKASASEFPRLRWTVPGSVCLQKQMAAQNAGRLVGETVDVDGKRAYVLTLQAREQHIRREKATSKRLHHYALIASCSTFYMASSANKVCATWPIRI